MKRTNSPSTSRHLSVVPEIRGDEKPLTRGQVAERLGVSVSTVRRYEGSRLHPNVDADAVHWFDPKEVAGLVVELAQEPRATRRRNAATNAGLPVRSRGEIAALVFELFEQRQSLPEIVIALRIEPETVRGLFEQWCLGLIEGELQMKREPRLPREAETVRELTGAGVARRLAELPEGALTRISVGRFRGIIDGEEYTYPEILEVGGFHVSGPCTLDEITERYGNGPFRITAYGFDPPGLRWEVLLPNQLTTEEE